MKEEILARIPKGCSAEIRIVRQQYRGREVIDIRVWSLPANGSEFKRSKRGMTLGIAGIGRLLAALQEHFP